MQICNGFLIPKQTKTRTFHSHKHFSMKDIKKKRNISYLYSSVDANTDANTKIDDNDDIQTIAPSLSELFPSLHKPLETLGYVTPTPIQNASAIRALNLDNLLLIAPTGSGKTFGMC